jgi:hypothetical protein
MKPAVGSFAVVESEQAAGRLDYQLAELIEFEYWFNIFLLGAANTGAVEYAARTRLLSAARRAILLSAVRRRALIAQSLYAIATALSIFDTRISIAAIVLVQLN